MMMMTTTTIIMIITFISIIMTKVTITTMDIKMCKTLGLIQRWEWRKTKKPESGGPGPKG